MNAIQLLASIKSQGVNLTLIDGDKLKVHPRSALNDNIRSIIRTNKLMLIATLRHEHIAKRKALGYRVEILKALLSRLLSSNFARATRREYALEKFTDNVLRDFKYNLEKAIDYYRSLAPEVVIVLPQCVKCGYMPPFCSCKQENKI